MTDKELLELAARANGFINYDVFDDEVVTVYPYSSRATWVYWKPLTDDGDALRLAVKLKMDVVFDDEKVGANCGRGAVEVKGNDPYAATRRAIVRAAAEIGKDLS